MRDSTSFDVLMAGGGLMGCAIAYYLLDADPTLRVAIVEKDPSYRHNSTVLSDGNLRVQFNLAENIRISLYGLERLKTFADDMAVGDWRPEVGFRQQGNLFLADEARKGEILAGMAAQQRLGCEVEWLEPSEIAARYPLLDATKIAGGAFGRLDGTMDPNAVLMGFRRKAVALGATFIEGEASEVLHAGGRVTGLRLADGSELRAPWVVNSAGAWGTALARTAGVELPIDPVMRQVFVLQTPVAPTIRYPLTFFPSGIYLVHENGGNFSCAKSLDDDPVGFDFTWTRDKFMTHIWEELADFVPDFDRVKVVGGWAGLYDVNRFDGNAFLGEWPELAGFVLVNGFSGHGFQQGHAVGRYLAETIRGVEPFMDLSIFSPRRLLENQPVFEGRGKIV